MRHPNLDIRFHDIRAIILDIDGVLTDGTFGYSDNDEIKFFNAQDGLAIIAARRLGYIVGAISGRACTANRRRADELHFHFLYESIGTKIEVLYNILNTYHLTAEQCLYMGDDIQDVPVIKKVGIGAMPANAPEYIHRYADYITEKSGGSGAVREMIDNLLLATGKREELLKLYGVDVL